MERLKNWILVSVLGCLVILAPFIVSLNSAYIDLKVKVATIDAAQLKSDDMNRFEEKVRHAIKDAIQPITDQIKAMNDRLNGLEARSK